MKKIILMMFIALIGIQARTLAQSNLGARTRQSVRSGAISERERVVIDQQKQDVSVATRVAKSVGIITPAEQRIINQEKRQASRTIYAAKHNQHRR